MLIKQVYLCLYVKLDYRMSVTFCVMWETGVKNECETYLCKTDLWKYIKALIFNLRSVTYIRVGLKSTKKRWIFASCVRMTVRSISKRSVLCVIYL